MELCLGQTCGLACTLTWAETRTRHACVCVLCMRVNAWLAAALPVPRWLLDCLLTFPPPLLPLWINTLRL